MRLRSLACLLSCGALLIAERTAYAESSFEYAAPAGCPTRAEALATVALRAHDWPMKHAVSVAIAKRATGEGFVAVLVVDHAAPRAIEGAECARTVDAVSAILAVLGNAEGEQASASREEDDAAHAASAGSGPPNVAGGAAAPDRGAPTVAAEGRSAWAVGLTGGLLSGLPEHVPAFVTTLYGERRAILTGPYYIDGRVGLALTHAEHMGAVNIASVVADVAFERAIGDVGMLGVGLNGNLGAGSSEVPLAHTDHDSIWRTLGTFGVVRVNPTPRTFVEARAGIARFLGPSSAPSASDPDALAFSGWLFECGFGLGVELSR